MVAGEPVDVLGGEALEVVEVVSLELGMGSARGCLLDCGKRGGAVAFAELQQDRGADVRRLADWAPVPAGQQPAGIDLVAPVPA